MQGCILLMDIYIQSNSIKYKYNRVRGSAESQVLGGVPVSRERGMRSGRAFGGL